MRSGSTSGPLDRQPAQLRDNDVKDFTLAVMGAITGLTGAILGYYYGKEAEKGRSGSQRRRSGSQR
jgi:hypothetical protein